MSRGIVALVAVLALAAATAPLAAAESMAVQPDGKIVLLGRAWPQAGEIARLEPNGQLDQSFGEGGFVVDRRLPSFISLALQPNGDVVAAAVGGDLLARYLPDGSPDPSFAGGGVGGTDEEGQVHFPYDERGPVALLIQPGGQIVTGVNRDAVGGGATDAYLRRYDSGGSLIETPGHVPLPSSAISGTELTDLIEAPDGSILGTGWGYEYPNAPHLVLGFLARFVPGSGVIFDSAFGGGSGLVQLSYRSGEGRSTVASAALESGGKLLVAGKTAGTIMLARFDQNGVPDASFGEGGFTAPPISGPADAAAKLSFEGATTWANALAVTSGGSILVGGGTSQWGTWATSKAGTFCSDCPQPVLARFDSSGHLESSFGEGGLLRLHRPDGSTFAGGEIKQIVALPEGKLLVSGTVPNASTSVAPFVTRLQPDGRYDPSFGEGGLAEPRFPCSEGMTAAAKRQGCVAVPRAKLRLADRPGRPPSLHLRVRPSVPWASVQGITLTMPGSLRLTRAARSKLQVRAGGSGEGLKIYVSKPRPQHPQTTVFVKGIARAKQVTLNLPRGSLHLRGDRSRRRKLTFAIGAEFAERWGYYGGAGSVQRVTR
ncbi:MAG TPA: delta-60 repeat domain-containing protein [Solirubrobacterales bacterium]